MRMGGSAGVGSLECSAGASPATWVCSTSSRLLSGLSAQSASFSHGLELELPAGHDPVVVVAHGGQVDRQVVGGARSHPRHRALQVPRVRHATDGDVLVVHACEQLPQPCEPPHAEVSERLATARGSARLVAIECADVVQYMLDGLSRELAGIPRAEPWVFLHGDVLIASGYLVCRPHRSL